MSCYVIVNDIHLSDKAPSSCTDDYLDDLFTLLGEVSASSREIGAKGIILAGDVFHHKIPSRTTHATVMRLITWAQAAPCPVYAVLGNHDLSHDRVASIDETQPLGVVIKSGAVTLLDGWIDNGDPVYGVPWLTTYDEHAVRDALAGWREAINPSDRGLVVTHAPLYPPGQELPYEFYPAPHWAAAMNNVGTVHYGHVHDAHGVYEVDGTVFSNSGALSRGSLTEHNLTREVKIAVWHLDTGAIEHRTIPHKSAEEIFRLAEVISAKAARVDLSSFLGSVDATQLTITSTESVVAHIRSLGIGTELEVLLLALLDCADNKGPA